MSIFRILAVKKDTKINKQINHGDVEYIFEFAKTEIVSSLLIDNTISRNKYDPKQAAMFPSLQHNECSNQIN